MRRLLARFTTANRPLQDRLGLLIASAVAAAVAVTGIAAYFLTLLVVYDRAGMNDPLYDVGVLMAEITDFPYDARPVLAAYLGRFDEHAFARARLWGIVDDMLHALWSRRLARTSARRGVEWLKYGEWRLMRLRMALNDPGFEQLIRLTKEGAA